MLLIGVVALFATTSLRAETVSIPEPAPVEKIMGKDVAGWVEHLKRFENEFERKKAMLCLADFGPAAADAVGELRALMKDELQVETQRFAIMTLGPIGPAAKVAVPDLLAALNDANRPVAHRAAALASLAEIDPQSPAVRKAVLAAVRDGAPEVRAEALDALVTIAPYEPTAVATLNRSLLIPDDTKHAAQAFMSMGAAGVDPLLKALERGEPAVRAACAEALSAMGGEAAKALPLLIKGAKRERDAAGREPYVLAAARISPKNAEVLDLLVEQLVAKLTALPLANKEEAAEPAQLPLEARLLLVAGDAAMPAIQKGLRSRDARVRLMLVDVLARLQKALPADAQQNADIAHELLSRAQDRDNAVSLAAIKALDTMGPTAASAKEGLAELGANAALEAPLRRAAQLAALNVAREPKSPRHRSPLETKTDAELLKLLRNPNAAVRQDAAEALLSPRGDNPELAKGLIDTLTDPDENVRIAAARSLVRYGKYAKDSLPTFTEWLESESVPLKKAALAALAGMAADARPALDVVAAVATSPSTDKDPELRKLLAIVLRMIGPDAVPKLIESLKANDAAVRARAARAVASMKDVGATAIPDLIELTKSAVDSDAEAGFAALQEIGPVAYHVAGPHLIQTLRADAFADRRKWATWALGEIKVPAEGDNLKVIDALMEALLDTDAAVCRGAHAALVAIGDAALPRLRDLLRIGEGETPYWAVRVMARLKADPADVIPRLAELTLPGKLPVERAVAAELLGQYAPQHPEIIPVLLRVLSDREDYVARAAIRSLAIFGDEALPPVRNLLKQRSPLVRRRAVEALAGIRDHKEGGE